jgi:hypothetical protein
MLSLLSIIALEIDLAGAWRDSDRVEESSVSTFVARFL